MSSQNSFYFPPARDFVDMLRGPYASPDHLRERIRSNLRFWATNYLILSFVISVILSVNFLAGLFATILLCLHVFMRKRSIGRLAADFVMGFGRRVVASVDQDNTVRGEIRGARHRVSAEFRRSPM
eukprot:TRINITY_DN31658_c0_g1_i1.p1 TRINITY_DN31658_c0_g1~~TRINITY_DN31658_c0_g1_i1.p1  ORF type:complete len:126 (+),score=8.06 TRINITY_DN31658_c0_g1_i1:134-511(+)